MSETDDRFLERLTDEAERLLGPATRVERLERQVVDGGVRVAAVLRTPTGAHRVEATGASILDAAGALLGRLPEERLALAFRQLVARGGEVDGRRRAGA